MVDFSGVVEIVGDHDANNSASGQTLTPVCETVAVQFRIVPERTDGGEPTPMTFREPGDEFVTRARACAVERHEGRLIAAEGGRAKRVILIHPFTPGDMFENTADGTASALRERRPIFIPQLS